jgi:hypothetical protein
MRRLRAPGLESLFVAALVLFGFRLGALPISDNSMFTHLRTGIDMAGGAGVPREDPYSYTAAGAEWVVQSWLAAWSYGALENLGGFRLVVLQHALLMALLAFLVARLARAGTPLRTGLSATLAVGLGAPLWSPRPLMFGLICFALVVTVVEKRRTPWLLLPIVWVWANTHGSFPIGLVWLGARAAGEWLDWRYWPKDTARYVWAFLGGLALSVANPLGAKLLLFPLTLGEKSAVFARVVEWRSPDFHGGRVMISLLVLAVVLTLLFRARLTWRDAVPAMVFLILSLYAVRNVPLLAVVLAPVLQRIMRRPESARPRPSATPTQLRTNRALAATLAAAFLLFGIGTWNNQPLRLDTYPVEAVDFLEANGLLEAPNRLAHQDVVGNYLQLRFGRSVEVFIDDRVDMYPVAVSDDYFDLLRGARTWDGVIDRYGVNVVLWSRDLPLAQLLTLDPRWRQAFSDEDWVVFRRAG